MTTNRKRIASAAAALLLAAAMTSVTAFATAAPVNGNNEPAASSDITVERSAHTYKYYQIFTGEWYTNDDGTWLTDAKWGADIDMAGLLDDDEIKAGVEQVYVNRAISAGLVKLGEKETAADKKMVDVEEAVKQLAKDKQPDETKKEAAADAAWAVSPYNIATATSDEAKLENVLSVFKLWQDSDTSVASENPLIAGSDYVKSDDQSKRITNGEAKVADKIGEYLKGDGTELTADYNEEKKTTVDNGYYYIKETDTGWDKEGRDLSSDPEGKKAVLLRIVDRAITVDPKIGTPTVEKKIAENVKDIESVGDGLIGGYKDGNKLVWNDAADYSIGDEVPFMIYGSLPENINDYAHYFYQFKDTLAAGFVAPKDEDIKVEIGKVNPVPTPADGDNAAAERAFTATADITSAANIDITQENNDTSKPVSVKITFDDLQAVGVDLDIDTVIRVTYKAVLDTDAVIGALGNTNGVSLAYSTDVNYNGTGIDKDDTGTKPGDEDKTTTTKDKTGDGDSPDDSTTTISETTTDGVTAFTYQLQITKQDSADDSKKLAGAKFTVQALDGDHEGKYVKINADNTVAGWEEYTEEQIKDKEFKGYLESGDDGLVKVVGLDDGKYQIVEIEAPKGYNKLRAPVNVTISATLNNNGTYTYIVDDGSEAYLSFNAPTAADEALADVSETDEDGKSTGKYAVTIGNNKGLILPQTGGMGAAVLYGSGILVAALGCGAMVTTVKRKKDEE